MDKQNATLVKDSINVKIVLVIIIVLFLLFVVPLINCEVLTILYGEEFFSEAYSDNYMSVENGYKRVIKYNGNKAEVYAVNASSAVLWQYEKVNAEWQRKDTKVVWTTMGGNAAEIVWPYWWHFIYW